MRLTSVPTHAPRGLATAAAIALLVSAASVAGVARSAPRPQIPTGERVLVGRVLDVGTGDGIGGAQVSLIGYLDEDGQLDSSIGRGTAQFFASSFEKRVIATADGTFVFRGLPAGGYRLVASAQGYAAEAEAPQFVAVADDDTPTSIAFHLWRYGSISGRVVDDRGQPVVDVPVAAMELSAGARRLASSRIAGDFRTDDRGVYRIPDLRPGSYAVAVTNTSTAFPSAVGAAVDTEGHFGSPLWLRLRDGGGYQLREGEGIRIGDTVLQTPGTPPLLAPDGSALVYRTTFHPAALSIDDATVIAIESGESQNGVDIPITYEPARRVSGRVVGPEGRVNQLVLRLLPPGNPSPMFSARAGVATAITAADGSFVFPAVPPGSYTLSTALLPITERLEDEWSDVESLWAMDPVTVAGDDLTDLQVTLRPGVHMTGRVVFDGAPESPLAENQTASVLLLAVGGGSIGISAAVRPDGSFTSLGVPPGRYRIVAQIGCRGVMGCAPDWRWLTTTRNGSIVPLDVVDLTGGDVEGFELHFSNRPASIGGTVVDADGGVVTNAAVSVVAFPADTTLWQEDPTSFQRIRVARLSPAGTFLINGLAPGEYHVAALPVWRSVRSPGVLEELVSGAVGVTLRDGEQASTRVSLVRQEDR